MVKAYYELAKPGIIYGNVLSAVAGFLLASKWHISLSLFIGVLVGTSLVIASACVFNNYIDRSIDEAMARTQKRALVQGVITPVHALIYATILGAVGFCILILWTNWLVVLIGAIAFIDYVVFYGIAKRHSPWGTIVGSVSGSAPLVAGYVAYTGVFDAGAAILFAIMTAWQMPHFYTIGMFRAGDYKAAGLPILPVARGMHTTKIRIIGYIVAFNIAIVALKIAGYAGYTFLVVMLIFGLVWLWRAILGLKTSNDVRWARKTFFFSLLVLLAFCASAAVGSILP